MSVRTTSWKIGVLMLSIGAAASGAWADRVGDLPDERPAVASNTPAVASTDTTSEPKITSPVTISPTKTVATQSSIEPPVTQPPVTQPPVTQPPRDLGSGVAVQDCAVRFAEELNLPSTEAGLIADLSVTVGQPIVAGDAIARLDDRALKIRSRAAQLRLSSAQEQISDDVELRYAQTARAEAIAELDTSRAIYNESSGAVPLSNLRRLKLAVERAELEVTRAQKAAKQAQIEVDLRAADVAILDDTMRRYALSSPISGVVLQVFKQRGEWVASGEAVVRLARLDRLQVQALMSSDQCSPNECLNQPVSVNWTDPISGKKLYLRGRVTSVQPQRLAGGRYRIQAEIVNDRLADGKSWLLHPGTEIEMVVYPPRGLISGIVADRSVDP